MKQDKNLTPTIVFEVNWGICNGTDGICALGSGSVADMIKQLRENYICIGPDIHREGDNPMFEESKTLLAEWRKQLYIDARVRVKVGRWRVEGSPLTILIDFSSYFPQKDDVLKFLWETYKVDSISGQWNYIESVLFGVAAGKVIESYVEQFCSSQDSVVASMHQWMTASVGLYLRKYSPYIANVFVLDSTVVGKSVADAGLSLPEDMASFNSDEYARRFGVVAQHSLEKIMAEKSDCLVATSPSAVEECKYILSKEADAISDSSKSYLKANSIALRNAVERTNRLIYAGGGEVTNQINFVKQQLNSSMPNWSRLMVEHEIPDSMRPLEEMSRNIWWSWTLNAHALFESIDSNLWVASNKNPIEFLDKLPSSRIRELEADNDFLQRLDALYAQFKDYMAEKKDASAPKIAYFSMEYGLTHTLKIYSGGLGILAGDYLKEASDKNVPMVAVGLLYRYGYFTQRLSAQGDQEVHYEAQNFYKLPISPVRDEEGNWKSVQIAFPGRIVTARIWRCDVGRTELYLLDTDHELNIEEDRQITYHLYGGDWENRLKQELVLGVGGIRALNELGIKQDVYHCNEGHAAFIGLERIYNIISNRGLSFSEALEVVRSSSLFTTHTPVPAGHDAFPEDMIRQYMSHYPERLGITWDQFINLGKIEPNNHNEKFSMSYLACNLSQEVNGVSWLHGEVSKDILGGMWPGYFKDELHIGYVTNGVHFPTWTAGILRRLYAEYFADGFSSHQYDIPAWGKVHNISNEVLWGARMHLKNKLINLIRDRVSDPSQVRFDSPRQMIQIKESLKSDVLTIGFARRFATYKRAHLLFTNLERLSRIVNNPDRPVQFFFAGKAHPNDKPGQDLIKRIVEVSTMPQFLGKIIFLQNYDIDIARKMVQGVDVWLNTPTRPLEASGTSGEKAVMNGVLNFSVMDGWWVEGYKEGAGWMLPQERTFADQRYQDELDAEVIYNTIEEEIVPMYYHRDSNNTPFEWCESIKRCVANIASEFTTNRMITDYQERFYNKLYERAKSMRAQDYILAREIAAWKRNVSSHWDNVHVLSVKQYDIGKEAIVMGHKYRVEVVVDVDGLSPEEIGVEMIVASQINSGNDVKIVKKQELTIASVDGSVVEYVADSTPNTTGTFDVAFRVYPKSDKLAYRQDFALVKWA